MRIEFLIEKYEILKAQEAEGESSEDLSEFDPTPQKSENPVKGFV